MNPNPSESPEALGTDPFARLALRVANDPGFMANAIEAYLAMEDLTASTLAQRWGCSMEQLRRLQLCRRPDSAAERFPDDVAKLAEYSGIAEEHIIGVLRQCEVIDELTKVDEYAAETPASLAARDREDRDPTDEALREDRLQ